MVDGAAEAPGTGRLAGWFKGYRSALAGRDLRLLLGAEVVSVTCSWAFNVALFAFVFDRTHSFGWVGAAGAARFLSALLFSPLGGVMADRVERIRLMIGSDVACALWQAGAAAAAAAGGPVMAVIVLAALTTMTGNVYPPAVAATIPTLVDEDDLVAANALNGTIDNIVVIAGPAIGAALLLAGSPALVFAINAGSFAISALAVSRIRRRTEPAELAGRGVAGALRQMSEGLHSILTLSAARTLVAFSVLVSFVYGTDTVLFVAVSANRLGTGSHGFGYLLAGLGVGGILMAAAVDRIARSPRVALIIVGGTVGYCLPTALLAVIHSPGLAFAIQIVRGAATLVVDVLAITTLQRAVPSDQVARVFGIFFAFVLGAIALGTAVTPAVISAIGLNGALFAMAFGTAALGLLGLPSLLQIDRQAVATAEALAPAVALLQQLEIFAAASQPVLERLAAAAVELEFSPGTKIIREGDTADALYVLGEGEVEVSARGELGSERIIRTMSSPSYFGEIGVLQRIPRTATVTALSYCRCGQIDGQALLDALTATPPSSSLMENASSRLAITHPSLAAS